MTRSDVTHSTLARETVQLLQQETPNFVSPDMCSPNSPVDNRISGLMQERVYIAQTPVRDTSRCDQWLEAAPHWHMGKHAYRTTSSTK